MGAKSIIANNRFVSGSLPNEKFFLFVQEKLKAINVELITEHHINIIAMKYTVVRNGENIGARFYFSMSNFDEESIKNRMMILKDEEIEGVILSAIRQYKIENIVNG
jgi:hypothetical protein